jgi:hypothetical protein
MNQAVAPGPCVPYEPISVVEVSVPNLVLLPVGIPVSALPSALTRMVPGRANRSAGGSKPGWAMYRADTLPVTRCALAWALRPHPASDFSRNGIAGAAGITWKLT